MRNVFAVGPAGEPEFVGEQPDVDAEFVQDIETALRRGSGDQMCFDRVQLWIDDRTSIEGPDRQRDREPFDQKPHADGGPAGDDGETDICRVQFAHRGLGRLGDALVPRQQRAVDIGHHQLDFGHASFN